MKHTKHSLTLYLTLDDEAEAISLFLSLCFFRFYFIYFLSERECLDRSDRLLDNHGEPS